MTLEGFGKRIPIGSLGLSQDVLLVLLLLVNLLVWIVHLIISTVEREVHFRLGIKVRIQFFLCKMRMSSNSEHALVLHHVLEHLRPDSREIVGLNPERWLCCGLVEAP